VQSARGSAARRDQGIGIVCRDSLQVLPSTLAAREPVSIETRHMTAISFPSFSQSRSSTLPCSSVATNPRDYKPVRERSACIAAGGYWNDPSPGEVRLPLMPDVEATKWA